MLRNEQLIIANANYDNIIVRTKRDWEDAEALGKTEAGGPMKFGDEYVCGTELTDAELADLLGEFNFANEDMRRMAEEAVRNFLFKEARICEVRATIQCFSRQDEPQLTL